jgi:osmotically inducible lipoprotein OsmB
MLDGAQDWRPHSRFDERRIWRQIMKRTVLAVALLFSLGALGACGNTTGDRALSGGGIGAGVGALGGLMVGAPLEGALIGGAVGAGTGALTNRNQVNLGRPVWR